MKKIVFFALILNIFISNVFAESDLYKPTKEFYINDFADIITSSVEKTVSARCSAIEKKTTAQVVVVTVPDLEGEDIGKYAYRLYSQWRIGDSRDNNGVLILISKAQRKIKVEVGYGLSGILHSGKVNKIVEDVAMEYLKKNDFNTAVKNIVYEIQGIIYYKYGIEGGFDHYDKESYSLKTEIIVAIGVGVVILATPFIYNFIKKRKRRFY
ncbi:MAG: TPM domain-containing protein [Clostridia bacterium]|nr:TPM domain-containing protein [Clostridia bacterium]